MKDILWMIFKYTWYPAVVLVVMFLFFHYPLLVAVVIGGLGLIVMGILGKDMLE